MKFEQAILGGSIKFFRKGFMDRWGFKDYHDTDKPAVFFGLDSPDMFEKFKKHKGYKIFLPSTPNELNYRQLIEAAPEKTIMIWSGDGAEKIKKEINFLKYSSDIVEIKDYSIFKPNTLGDKIYYYSGFKNGWSSWSQDIIKEIQKNVDFELFTTEHNYIQDYHDITYLKNNYYDKAFLNLNILGKHGMTTVIEMGLMGRKTITMRNKKRYNYNSFIDCSNIEEIVKHINIESKKINTLQEKIDVHTLGNEWIDLNFWLNK